MARNRQGRPLTRDLPRGLIPIYGITFLDILGFTILVPLLPFVAKRFGAPDAMLGILLATTAVCATVSSPLWGALSDRFGRKRALLGSQCASFAAYLLIALAGGIPLLFLSRAIEGLGGGNLGIASAYVVDVTSEERRPQALALGTAAFGAGFIVGPILGGALARFGFAVPFFVAAGLQAVNGALTFALLPESHAPARETRAGFGELRSIARIPGIANVLWRRFLYIFAFTSFFTTFSLYLAERYGASAGVSSVLLALAGGVGAAVQIAVVGPVTRRFGVRATLLGAFAAGVVAYGSLAFADGLDAFALVVVLWAFSGALLRPVLDARIAELVPEASRGAVLGFGDALDNASLIVGPTIGAAIVGIAPRLAGILPACALAAGGLLTYRDRARNRPKR